MQERRLKEDAAQVERADLTTLLSRWPRLQQRVQSSPRLRPFVDNIATAYALLQDYVAGRYQAIPWSSIAAIVAALLYVLNPLDMIPDLLPFVGFIDDAGILAICWRMVQKDIEAYRRFRAEPDDSVNRETPAAGAASPPERADSPPPPPVDNTPDKKRR